MAKVKFNPRQFWVDAVQYFIAVAVSVYLSPWIGVFIAMIKLEVR